MQDETWRRIEELFAAAIAESPERREQFLETACPDDPELRAEVLSLLKSCDTAGSFLEDSPVALARTRPQLERGHNLGHFEIVDIIGRGGMGDVYRARDTRLKREVAVKVLPPEFARDPVRVLRFEREARAASALNHPNIVSIYDVGHEGRHFWIVSELVQGRLLRELMKGRTLPVRRAVEIGMQIADGLAAAHAAGIVHRDLKPGNVMITPEGRIKILDFGLAKTGCRATSDVSATVPLSAPGLIMGTPGYMAPEQIAGKPVDERSDIFALGVILHEMLSGAGAFRGESRIELLSANLSSDPAALPASVPPVLQRITLRCLEREPSKRFQSAADLGFALEAVSDLVTRPRQAGVRAATWPRWAVIAAVAAMLGAGAFYAAGVRLMRNEHEADATLTRLTTDSGLTTDGAISGDGKLVAFASDRAGEGHLDIWVKQIGAKGPAVRLTTGSADDYDPAFSPDASQIVFRSERKGGGVYEIPALGGDARLLVPYGRRPRFSPDGRFLMYWTGLGNRGVPSGVDVRLFVQPVSGGPPLRVGAACKYIDSTAVWSPDSKRLLFEGFCGGKRGAWVFDMKTNSLAPRKELYEYFSKNSFVVFAGGPAHPAVVFHEWLAQPSRVLLSGFSARALSLSDAVSITSVPIAEDAMRVTGARRRLTFETQPEYRASAASNGRIALSSGSTNSEIWSLPIDEAGRAMGEPVQLTAEVWSGAPWLSRDGRTLALQSRRGEGWGIYSISLGRGERTSLYTGASPTYQQVVDWKGTAVAYLLDQEEQSTLWQVATSGGLPQKLLNSFFYPTDWSPDSRFLIGLPDRSNRQVGILDVQTRTETTVLRDSKRELYQAHFSNDGSWVTFMAVGATDSGTHSRVYVAPFRKSLVPQSEWVAITDGTEWDDKPHFSYRDNVLFFTSDRDGYRCIWAQPLQPDKKPSGKPFPVHHSHQSRRSIGNVGLGMLELAVGPEALMFNQQEFTGNIWLLDPTRNE